MKTLSLTICVAAAALVAAAPHAQAQSVIAEWTFDSQMPDGDPTSGSIAPSTLMPGLPVAPAIVFRGGVSAVFASAAGLVGSSGSGPDNTVVAIASFPEQLGGSGLAGFHVVCGLPAERNQFFKVSYRMACAPTASASQYSTIGFSAQMPTLGANAPYTAASLSADTFTDFTFGPMVVHESINVISLDVVSVFRRNRLAFFPPFPITYTSYSTSAPWYVDRITVSTVPNNPPTVEPFTLFVDAGGPPVFLQLEAHDPDVAAGHLDYSGSGDPHFSINSGVYFTPPATPPAHTTDYSYIVTVTDTMGLSASAPIAVTVPGAPGPCDVAVTPLTQTTVCYTPDDGGRTRGLLTATPPPGEGGEVECRWLMGYSNSAWYIRQAGSDLTFVPPHGGWYRAAARRVGGTGGDSACEEASWSVSETAVVWTLIPDIGTSGGIHGSDEALNNNDFISFIDYFFERNLIADFGSQAGTPGGDGLLDSNDFIVFIDAFFGGCMW